MSGLAKWAASTLLKVERFRIHLAFLIKYRHYTDLKLQVLLSDGLACPVLSDEAWLSFSEVFVLNEYEAAFPNSDYPARWLDLGAHVGYFSLYVVWKRLQAGLPPGGALLVDADARCVPAINAVIERNRLEASLHFLPGMIASSESPGVFIERPGMGSSADALDETDPAGHATRVLSAADILKAFAPPYDLIKVDIEGGEFDLLNEYAEVLDRTNRIVIEWHSWHRGGGGRREVIDLLAKRGFENVTVIVEERIVDQERSRRCGVLLAQR